MYYQITFIVASSNCKRPSVPTVHVMRWDKTGYDDVDVSGTSQETNIVILCRVSRAGVGACGGAIVRALACSPALQRSIKIFIDRQFITRRCGFESNYLSKISLRRFM